MLLVVGVASDPVGVPSEPVDSASEPADVNPEVHAASEPVDSTLEAEVKKLEPALASAVFDTVELSEDDEATVVSVSVAVLVAEAPGVAVSCPLSLLAPAVTAMFIDEVKNLL